MTKLRTIVKRETQAVFRKLPLIIQIEPPGIIRVKEKGKRTWFETSIEAVYCMAARQKADRDRAEKKATKLERKRTR